MNKTQTVLAAIGGTVVVGALVLGYFIWDASDTKAANAGELDGCMSSMRGVMKDLPIEPKNDALEIYKTSATSYETWRKEASALAARGDLVFENTTPAEFKTTLVSEARRLANRPGCFEGKAVRADFHFGFKDYVTGGAMPPEKDLKRLQREWNDVMTVLNTIANCCSNDVGIADVRMGKAKQANAEAAAEETTRPGKKKNKAKKKAKAVVADEHAAEGAGKNVTSFEVDFMARPSGLVKTLNALTSDTRFIVVEKCTFAREGDALAAALGGDAKKDSPASARPGRTRRNRASVGVATQTEDGASTLVTDPATAPLVKVTLAVSVYDFGSLEEDKKDKEEAL